MHKLNFRKFSISSIILALVLITLIPINYAHAAQNPTFVNEASASASTCCNPSPVTMTLNGIVKGNALVLVFAALTSTLVNLTFTDSMGIVYTHVVNATDLDSGKPTVALYVAFAPSSGSDTITAFTRRFASLEIAVMQYKNVDSFGSNNFHSGENTNVCPPCPPLASDNWNVPLFTPLSAGYIHYGPFGNGVTTFSSLGTLRLNETAEPPGFPASAIILLGVDTSTGLSGLSTNTGTSGTSHYYDDMVGVQLNPTISHALQPTVDVFSSILPIFSVFIFSLVSIVIFGWNKFGRSDRVIFPEGEFILPGAGGNLAVSYDMIIGAVLALLLIVSLLGTINGLS